MISRIVNFLAYVGYSVLDMVKAFETSTGKTVKYKITERRAGDIATCYADTNKAKEELGWVAERGIEESIREHRAMLNGFPAVNHGVTGCRIIDSPRERLIAIITNNFVPCNGRFPTLIVMFIMFFSITSNSILNTNIEQIMKYNNLEFIYQIILK